MNNNIIEVNRLIKRYNGKEAVKGISFEVKRGEIFAFLGPNGAGKTTTIKILTTLLHPTAGRVKMNGYNPLKYKHRARGTFGIVFQDQSLDEELTAYENMYFHAVLYNVPKKIRGKRVKELMEFVKLWERKDDQVKKFSGGMRRRLEIARGFLHTPKLIFLDEPTLGLDPQTRNAIWEYIKKLNKKEKITIFLTTHIMEEAQRMADRVAIIDEGKIIALDTPKKLVEKTKTKTLEDAFLKLTGKEIREESANSRDNSIMQKRMRRGR